MQVRTERLLLRGVAATDVDAWIDFSERSDALHAPWMPLPEERVDPRKSFAGLLTAHESGTCFKAVAIADDGRVAAIAGLNQIMRGPVSSAMAGWAVHVDFAGRGVMTEAVLALLDLAFSPDGLGLHRVAAGIMPENLASLRVAERAGFRREGLARELVQIGGEWRDHVMFAKLAREHVR